jgi:hypothetical protein
MRLACKLGSEGHMYLIMIASYGITLFLGALLYKYISDKRRAARKGSQGGAEG